MDKVIYTPPGIIRTYEKYEASDNGDVLILKNKAGKKTTRMRIKKYPSGNLFISIGDYEKGQCVSENIISLNMELRAKLKEWL